MTEMQDPWAFPPGPERRRLMTEQHYNIAPQDFSDAELAEMERRDASSQAAQRARSA